MHLPAPACSISCSFMVGLVSGTLALLGCCWCSSLHSSGVSVAQERERCAEAFISIRCRRSSWWRPSGARSGRTCC